MNYWSDKKVLITGGTGFLGRHLKAALEAFKPKSLRAIGSQDYDLTSENHVLKMFQDTKPNIVFHLAGLVGGILANKERPADFFYKNLMIGSLVTHHAYHQGVEKLIGAGAGCGYPEFAPMPLKETDLWAGTPQKESAPYSLAKRMLAVQSEAYFRQHGFCSTVCIPGNIYGEYDNFNLNESHVIPALVRKFTEAAKDKKAAVQVWGSGTPTRDYVYAGDVAKGMVRAAEVYRGSEIVNLSSGKETSVREICEQLRAITNFKGEIEWLTDKPEGQKRRWFDIGKAQRDLGFEAETSLQRGLERTVAWYQENLDSSEVRR